MKKLILLGMCVSLFSGKRSEAQLQKGDMLIGGDLANFDLGLNKGSTFTMNIMPKAAWFVRDNLAIGGYLDLGLATAKEAGTNVSYGVGALGRYYFPTANVNVARSTRFLVEANLGIQGINTPGSNGNNTNGLGYGIGPGLAYFVTDNIALESLLKYNGIYGFGSNNTSSRLSLNLGFQIYLPGNKVKSEIQKMK